MKKIFFIIIGLLLSIFTIMPSALSITTSIHAYLVNHNIEYKKMINDSLLYPLISYNDNTYISIRDVAKLFDKDIVWDEKEQKISLITPKFEQSVIKKPETALKIGKAILEEYYSDKISNKSVYHVTYAETDYPYATDYWFVSVIFNPTDNVNDDEILCNPDVRVEIDPITGSFNLMEVQIDGNFKSIIK